MTKQGEDARMAYLQQMIEGASKEELLLMLLEGAVKFINKAEAAFTEKKWDVAHNHLCRVQDIFHELMLSLDGELGDAAIQLNDIYGFINRTIIQANVDRDPDALEQAKRLILEVKNLWDEAVKLTRDDRAEGDSLPPEENIDEAPKSINITG